jgi:hypothetical protein
VTASPSDLPFAALLAYSPKGRNETSKSSRRVRDGIKNADEFLLNGAALRASEHQSRFVSFLGPEVVLVPVPRSAPTPSPGQRGPHLWPARRIADKLVERGMGCRTLTCLERVIAVRKSAYQQKGERPTVEEHIRSFAISSIASRLKFDRMTLIDDIVTKGRTLLAAATVLRGAYPFASVSAFALVRTRGLVPEIDEILDPCDGLISWKNDDAVRDP